MTNRREVSVPALLAAYAGFSFLLHFVWEMLQSPLYATLRTAAHPEAVRACALATVGDVGIALASFGCGAAAQRHWRWVLDARPRAWLAYLSAGLVVTVVLEFLATGPLQRWSYAREMPVLPLMGTAVLPLLQWLVVPAVAAWLTRRHMLGMR